MADNNLSPQTCCSCGIEFAVPKNVENMWRESKKQFYCPNGHPLVFNGPSSDKKKVTELESKIKQLESDCELLNRRAKEQKEKIIELQAELDIWKPREVIPIADIAKKSEE